MADQEILDNGPNDEESWTHHTSDNNYLIEDDGDMSYWCDFTDSWKSFRRYKLYDIRLRVDIQTIVDQQARIAELEKEKTIMNSRIYKHNCRLIGAPIQPTLKEKG